MTTVQFTPEFVLAAANVAMTKASNATNELYRLMEIGYLNSQTGLDTAKEIKKHLTTAYELLDKVNIPEAKVNQVLIGHSIARQDMIIRNIELSM